MSKYGPFTISARERSRLAWRQRVDAAARAAKLLAFVHSLGMLTSRCPGCIALREHRDALAAPRPWRSQRKPDPRRRYSRSHRRACRKCRFTLATQRNQWVCDGVKLPRRRNHHGRSDR